MVLWVAQWEWRTSVTPPEDSGKLSCRCYSSSLGTWNSKLPGLALHLSLLPFLSRSCVLNLVSYLWPRSLPLGLSTHPYSLGWPWQSLRTLTWIPSSTLFPGGLIWSCSVPPPPIPPSPGRSRKSFASLLRNYQHYCTQRGGLIHAIAVWAGNWFWLLLSDADKTSSYF